MSLNDSIKTYDEVESKLEDFRLELLQHANLKKLGVVSNKGDTILKEVEKIYETLAERESNGEDHTISKGLIEVFLREWSIIVLGE